MIYRSDRRFQLWDYTVSHAQLLLRSPATIDEPFNVDIVFVGVEKLEIPTRMNGLAMSGPEIANRGEPGSADLYRITSEGRNIP